MASSTKLILKKLDNLKSDIDVLKAKLVDVDLVVTDSDLEDLKQAELDFKSGKTKRV